MEIGIHSVINMPFFVARLEPLVGVSFVMSPWLLKSSSDPSPGHLHIVNQSEKVIVLEMLEDEVV